MGLVSYAVSTNKPEAGPVKKNKCKIKGKFVGLD
jgi:hypothetical protein